MCCSNVCWRDEAGWRRSLPGGWCARGLSSKRESRTAKPSLFIFSFVSPRFPSTPTSPLPPPFRAPPLQGAARDAFEHTPAPDSLESGQPHLIARAKTSSTATAMRLSRSAPCLLQLSGVKVRWVGGVKNEAAGGASFFGLAPTAPTANGQLPCTWEPAPPAPPRPAQCVSGLTPSCRWRNEGGGARF